MIKKFLTYILLAAILVVSPVSAVSDAVIDKMNSIESYYYNPEGNLKCQPNYTGDITVAGGTAEEKIWSALTSFLTPEQAAGIMGNLVSESGLNPVRHETSFINKYPNFDLSSSPKTAYGIGLAQWSFGRRISVYNFIKSRAPELIKYLDNGQTYGRLSGAQFVEKAGESVANQLISLEIEFLKDEINATYPAIKNATTVREATEIFLKDYERPGNPDLIHHPERLPQAEGIYGRLSGKTIEVAATPSGDPDCTNSSSITASGDAGSLQSLVLEYAWETYHSAPYTDRKPAYAEAVARRQAAGKYVGGSVGGVAGIDCGGFVTTLMQESGFAPDYNSGNGNTATQEAWVKSNGWQLLNSSPSTPVDTSILQPGDVAFTTGHTFVYVGNIPGFHSNVASASYGSDSGRAPMAGHESISMKGSEAVRWYRKP